MNAVVRQEGFTDCAVDKSTFEGSPENDGQPSQHGEENGPPCHTQAVVRRKTYLALPADWQIISHDEEINGICRGV
jgi:hypothetical protein